MGTSSSSKGPKGRIPIIPTWVPALEPLEDVSGGGNPPEVAPPNSDVPTSAAPDIVTPAATPPQSSASPIAIPARFASVRRNLGTFAGSGNKESMRKGVGEYVRKSYSGVKNLTARHGGTIKTAAALYSALSAGSTGETQSLDRDLLQGKDSKEIMKAIVEAVRPVDGTQDAEAGRASIQDALSDLLKKFDDADLLNLSEEQRLYVTERYLAMEIYRRLQLDIGNTIQDKAPDPRTALSRLKDVKDYIRETVSASFKKLIDAGERATARTMSRITQLVLRDTFQVFESYTQ